MTLYYLALAAGLIVAAGFLFSRAKGASIKNLFFKMASSLCFLLTAVCAVLANPGASAYGGLIIMGGILGLCGDAALDLKFIYPKDNNAYLRSGFIFFAIGHLFFNAALIWLNQLKWWWVLICIAAAFVIAVLNALSSKLISANTEIL